MRLVLLGESGALGGPPAGADALDAAVAALGERLGADVTAIGADDHDSRERRAVETVGSLGFGGLPTDEQRDARLEAVLAAAAGDSSRLAWDDVAWPAIQALTGADAVLLVGDEGAGPTDPADVYGRSAAAAVATALGRPVAVTGLAVGPHTTGRHRDLTAAVLTSAALVGVADAASVAQCRALGVPDDRLALTVDAAAGHDAHAVARWTPPAEPYIAASLSSWPGLLSTEEYVARLGSLLSHARSVSGLDVVLVRQQDPRERRSTTDDAAAHDALRAAAGTVGVHVVALDPAAGAAALRGAEAVLTTRPSAALVALGAGTPTLAIVSDWRTGRRTSSAMEIMGLGAFVLPAPSLLADDASQAFDELWARREAIGDGLDRLAETRRAEVGAWWDAVARALQGTPPPAAPTRATIAQVSAGSWSVRAADLRAWSDALDRALLESSTAADVATASADALAARQVTLEREIAELRTALDDAAADLAGMRESVRAAHELTEEHLAIIVRAAREAPAVAAVQHELDALRNTRTFRYLAGPRRVWSRLRSRS